MIFETLKRTIDILLKDRVKLFLVLFIAAFAVRLAYVLTLEEKWYFYDTVHYDKAAQSILNGEGFGRGYYFSSIEEFQDEYSLPPVYPIFLAGMYQLFGRDFLAVRICQSVLGALLTIFIFLIGSKVFDEKVGLLSALVSIFYPLLIFIGGLLYSTLLFTLFIALSVWFALKLEESERIPFAILSGLFLGMATLSGPILFAFYPLLGLWLVFLVQKPFLKKLKFAAVLFVAALLTLVPWGVRNYKIFGKITPVSASADWFLAEAQSRVQKELTIRFHQDGVGSRFEVLVNDEYDATLFDSTQTDGNGELFYAGLMLNGGLSKNIDEFALSKNLGETTMQSLVEGFSESELNTAWVADPVFQIIDGHLVNVSENVERGFLAVYTEMTNPSEVRIKWGKDTEAAGISQTGIVFLTEPSLRASGYLIKRQPYGRLELWRVEDGALVEQLQQKSGQKSLGVANGVGSDSEVAGGIFRKIIHIIADEPVEFLKHYISEFIHFWQLYPDRVMTKNQFTNWKTILVSAFTFGPVLLLSVFGLIGSTANWRKVALLFLVVMSFALGYSFFQTRMRYRVPVEPYMIILAAYGFLVIVEKFTLHSKYGR